MFLTSLSMVAAAGALKLAAQVDTALNELGLPDQFLEHATRKEILESVGLGAQQIAHDIVAQVLGAKVPHARKLEETSLTEKSIQQEL